MPEEKYHRKSVAYGDIISSQIIKITGMRRNAGGGKG